MNAFFRHSDDPRGRFPYVDYVRAEASRHELRAIMAELIAS